MQAHYLQSKYIDKILNMIRKCPMVELWQISKFVGIFACLVV